MRPPRSHRSIWVLLAWFTLSLGVAMASPALQVRAGHHDCPEMADEAASEHVHEGGDQAQPTSGHLHHCVLCGMLGGPPVEFGFAARQLPAAAPLPPLATGFIAHAAAPFSARAPPLA